ncbi:MAG: phosphotransferase, partial [Planctomycetaceae bacterium]|nr:phosphotransferase [Planctomycetaceae bacterium]
MIRNLADHMRLVDALRNKSAFPHAVQEITVLETHISSVLLTGELAYKIKKPVSPGFLDFSTLELRRTFCEEELRLNRRYAPDLYLDVVPVTGSITDPRVEGDGPALEFAVRMRQFPQSALLSERLRNGLVTREHIDQLARLLADFHRSAEVSPPDCSWGKAAEVTREALDNFSALGRSADVSINAACQRLEAWTHKAADELRPVFERRRSAGFVRECHGDLHLGNLFLWNRSVRDSRQSPGQVTMFDGIEFDPALRWIDVVSDAAFAVMDLHDRSRSDLAYWLQNA